MTGGRDCFSVFCGAHRCPSVAGGKKLCRDFDFESESGFAGDLVLLIGEGEDEGSRVDGVVPRE